MGVRGDGSTEGPGCYIRQGRRWPPLLQIWQGREGRRGGPAAAGRVEGGRAAASNRGPAAAFATARGSAAAYASTSARTSAYHSTGPSKPKASPPRAVLLEGRPSPDPLWSLQAPSGSEACGRIRAPTAGSSGDEFQIHSSSAARSLPLQIHCLPRGDGDGRSQGDDGEWSPGGTGD
uniref:Uncharacterized protein n=1 Tax=Oryza glumipatula TaxID=40148 RepID=A0A0E0AS65_9ORYZ